MLGGAALGFVMIGRSQGSNFNEFSLVNAGILAPLGFCTTIASGPELALQ
jgi:hypothetical protein